MYPPYEKLLLAAEQCPMATAVYLNIWKEIYDNGGIPLTHECDETLDCKDLMDDLEELQAWELLQVEYTGLNEIEISIPEHRNGCYLDV